MAELLSSRAFTAMNMCSSGHGSYYAAELLPQCTISGNDASLQQLHFHACEGHDVVSAH